ncbi:nucleoside kinase [Carboxylicivirga mesophila]|uniref:Nucleoside kinase n=1 Tax=Carboxylicivirga mesophila TaxID=1166478 RepID=A0ABS5KAN3_9BACT|nr:nucleoside kinase [Carboxylicivirga mesophila]MBS2212006.1 nucleoside kinase [Carboxylicivirga mesophila]
MKNVHIKCLNNDKTNCYKAGTTLEEIAKDLKVKLDTPILGAYVNNKLRELNYEVYHPKTIEFIDITRPDGMRMYIRSLSLVLYKAVNELYPRARLRIEHSVSKGTYCSVEGEELTIEDVMAIQNRMKEIIDSDTPFIRHVEESEEVIKRFEQQNQMDKAALIRHRGLLYTSFHQLEKHIGLYYGYLVPSTGYLKVFDLIKYYNGMLLQIPKRTQPEYLEEIVVQNKMFDIFQEFAEWNRVLNVRNLADINESCTNGKAETLIKISEALHEKKIGHIADMIEARKKAVKLVLISGPSSSGKTTFGKRLAIQLMVAGMKPVNLSLDNYFVNRENTPLDENGEYDFEALEALDVELFNQQLLDLLAGKAVEIPKFNFETGQRYYDGEKLQMNPDNVLVIEGIHGLNPKLTHLIPDHSKFKIYVSALTSVNIDDQNLIHTTDNRLIRRIVRDYKYRSYSAQATISRWGSVRRGEDAHIFPYQEEADVMFNTALLYELSVLKQQAEPILLEVQPNQPEYAEARRLLKFFGLFKPIQPNEIPPTSIIREFLGGSSFDY